MGAAWPSAHAAAPLCADRGSIENSVTDGQEKFSEPIVGCILAKDYRDALWSAKMRTLRLRVDVLHREASPC